MQAHDDAEEFSDELFEDFEYVRLSGLCNMWDRRCVQEAAEGLLGEEVDLLSVCADSKTYARLLVAFSAWKDGADAGA